VTKCHGSVEHEELTISSHSLDPLDKLPATCIGCQVKGPQQEVQIGMAISDYEAPQIVDLGAFADLTQKGTGKAQDSSEGAGSGV
jgi:hypothetical protein